MITLLRAQRKVIFFSILFIFGCSPALIKMDETERAQLKNQPEIQAVSYSLASLSVKTPLVAVAGGIFGSILASQEGYQVIQENSLPDPSIKVQAAFISLLNESLGLDNIRSIKEPPPTDDIEALKKQFGKGMIFDFKTIQWHIDTVKTPRMTYSARARLIRLEDSKVLWQGVCGMNPASARSVQMPDEMRSDGGAVFKIQLNEVANTCAGQLIASFLGTRKES